MATLKELNRLALKLMKEAEADGEPVTKDEALEMAEMELRNRDNGRRYEKSDNERKKSDKTRKVDEDKKTILTILIEAMSVQTEIDSVKNEVEFSFNFNENDYTVKLIKHRKPKEKK